MFDEILVFIKKKLNAYFNEYIERSTPGIGFKEYVAFLEGDKMEHLTFPNNKVTPILINLEEEKILRQGDRYEGILRDGRKTEVNPIIRINLMVLFVSKFTNYEQALKFLSLTVKYFQRHPIYDNEAAAELGDEIDWVRMELVTWPIAQQNELWNALRTSYIPSVLYKVSLVVFRDDEADEPYNEVKTVVSSVNQIDPDKLK